MKPEHSVVGIARGKEVEAVIAKVLDLVGGMSAVVRDGATVLVKPAMGYPPRKGQDPDEVLTNPRMVAALVSQAVDAGAKRVVVGEGSAYDLRTRWIFETSGMADAVRAAGGEVACFDEEPRLEREVPGGHLLRTVRIPQSVANADVIINVPKMYVHAFGGGGDPRV